MFIKLRNKNGNNTYLNINMIQRFEVSRTDDAFTFINFNVDEDILVFETPEEIMNLIELASMSKLMSWSGTASSNFPTTTITYTDGTFSK